MSRSALVGALLLTACTSPVQDPATTGEAAPTPTVPPVIAALSPASPAPTKPPDLVLITLESVRADHLALYGYPRETAPWLSALGEQSAVFEAAYSPSAWELPALASLFVGLYPNQHGVDRGSVGETAPTGQPRLPEAHETLAERLKAAGYATWGLSSTAFASGAGGFAQGFDTYVDLGFASNADVLAAVGAWGALPGDKPRFVWIHLRDPRGPYEARSPWAEAWKAEGAPLTALQSRAPDRDREARLAEAAPLVALYDSEIRATDELIPKIFSALGLGPEAVLALTATSGESFFDHGKIGRRSSLYDELIRVPLVIHWPGHSAVRVETPVSTLDLLPTLVQLATGLAPEGVSGSSLVPALTGKTPPARALPLELRMDDGRFLRGLVVGDKKLVRLDTGKIGGTPALFDRSTDPGELHDRAAENPAETAALNAALESWLQSSPAVPPGPLLTAGGQ